MNTVSTIVKMYRAHFCGVTLVLFKWKALKTYITDNGGKCGGNLYGSTGRVMSPNYPAPYPTRNLCVWYIRVKPENRIVLTMKAFQTEEGDDYVRVYDSLGTENLIAL